MVGAIGIGIAACVVTMTLYHAMSGDPIWWKSDRLYAVTMDNWDPNRPYDPARPQLPPRNSPTEMPSTSPDSEIPVRHVDHAQGSGSDHRRHGAETAGARQDTSHVGRFLRHVRRAFPLRRRVASRRG